MSEGIFDLRVYKEGMRVNSLHPFEWVHVLPSRIESGRYDYVGLVQKGDCLLNILVNDVFVDVGNLNKVEDE